MSGPIRAPDWLNIDMGSGGSVLEVKGLQKPNMYAVSVPFELIFRVALIS